LSDDLPLLEGRSYVVTGTSRGIGDTIASRLSAFGADVLAVSRSGGAPEPVAGRVVSRHVDLRDLDAPAAVLAEALAAFGHVDGLVNNAGVIYFADCWEHGDAEWDDVFATNLTAPFRLSQALARHWIELGREAAIVHIGSIESEVAIERQAAYAASKGGILGLTRALAIELAPHGIRVNALGPGVIATEMSDTMLETVRPRIPLGRMGASSEIGDVVAFLLSDLARYVTGTMLYADGGYTAR
jgi:NAD(P)-dependent dehydrogenase (short-subunit alcohol dehydrogenase family)